MARSRHCNRRIRVGDPNLEISGGGSTIVATDAMLADAEALREVHWLLTAMLGDLRIAAGVLEQAPFNVAVFDELEWMQRYARAACENSGELSERLTLAMEVYSVGEATVEWLAEQGSALLAFFAGTAFSGWVSVALGPMAIPMALALPWAVRDLAEDAADTGPNDVKMSPAVTAALSDPAVIDALRRAVSSADEAILGFGGYPALFQAALAGMGITGVSSTAFLLGYYASFAGMLSETPVTVTRVATTETAATTGYQARIEKIPPTGEPGAPQLRIDKIERPGAEPRYELYIGGTADFSPITGSDAFDLTSNIAGVAGMPAGSLRAVQQAMADAGVRADSEVTFTGHSQGGLLAAILASSGDYNTRGVVTIGAPAGNIILPAGIPAVIIENVEDFVPALGGVQNNTDALYVRNNVFTDGAPLPEVSAPGHRIEAYLSTAAAMDDAGSARVNQFGRELDDFSAGATTMTSMYYYASRT